MEEGGRKGERQGGREAGTLVGWVVEWAGGREGGRRAGGWAGGREGGSGGGGRVAKGVYRPSTFARLLVYQDVLERCRCVFHFIGKFIFAIVFTWFLTSCGG